MKQPLEPTIKTAEETKTQLPLVLGSSSPRRQELLQLLGIPFFTFASTVDESKLSAPTPRQFVELAAAEKCHDVAQHFAESSIIIGSDTMVCCASEDQQQGRIFGKPKDIDDARSTLQFLSGRSHEVITAIALIQTNSTQGIQIKSEITTVTFRELGDDEIETYIHSDEPHDKAGAYALQGHGARFIKNVNGDLLNVMGLPLQLLRAMLLPYYSQINMPEKETIRQCVGVRAARFL